MISIAPFRITADDLPDLEKKVRNGLSPMLEALNTSFGQLTPALGQLPTFEIKQVSLTTGDTVSDSFPLKFQVSIAQPKVVLLGNVTPKNEAHPLSTPFVMQGFRLNGTGQVQIPFITGLLDGNSYTFVFFVR